MQHVHYFFFFSSRRRHTRCSRDWSSDVCSSDLGAPLSACFCEREPRRRHNRGEQARPGGDLLGQADQCNSLESLPKKRLPVSGAGRTPIDRDARLTRLPTCATGTSSATSDSLVGHPHSIFRVFPQVSKIVMKILLQSRYNQEIGRAHV